MNAFPALSTARQKCEDVHEIPLTVRLEKIDEFDSIWTGPDHRDPFHEIDCPTESTALQNEVTGHETWVSCEVVP